MMRCLGGQCTPWPRHEADRPWSNKRRACSLRRQQSVSLARAWLGPDRADHYDAIVPLLAGVAPACPGPD